MSKIRKLLLSLGLLTLAVPAVIVAGAGPASAGLSPNRACADFYTGDQVRRLSICAQVWISDASASQSRGVVVMHTYKGSPGNWVDSVSQSITVNSASFYTNGTLRNNFGNDFSSTTCRVNGASSSWIACSVPNTERVVFYGTAWNGVAQTFDTCVWKVSWRDDRGLAHFVEMGDNSFPDKLPLCFHY